MSVSPATAYSPGVQEALDDMTGVLAPDLVERFLETAMRFPTAKVNHALNRNQIASKRWLVDAVAEVSDGRFDTVYVLAGWYGLVGALLLDDPRFEIGRVVNWDMEPTCAPIAESLNAPHVDAGRFRSLTRDVTTLRYDASDDDFVGAAPGLIVNTSGEHFATTSDWLDRVPAGTLVAVQSNDFYDCDVHINCVADLEAMKGDLRLDQVLFEGELKRKRYTRFMVIGRK